MKKRGRLILLGATMSGMAAAAFSMVRRRQRSALATTWQRSQPLEDVVTAMDVIDDAVRSEVEVSPQFNDAPITPEQQPVPAFESAESHGLEATSQPRTVIPPEQQPGGGPPHR